MTTIKRRRTWETRGLSPTAWLVRSAVIILVLAICGLVVDFGLWGPVRDWAWQSCVVTPVESAWGFHAEWQDSPQFGDQMVITAVTTDGAFASAGIRPGAIIPHPRCAWYAISGGFFGTLSEAADEARVRLVLEPGQHPDGSVVTVRRRQAP